MKGRFPGSCTIVGKAGREMEMNESTVMIWGFQNDAFGFTPSERREIVKRMIWETAPKQHAQLYAAIENMNFYNPMTGKKMTYGKLRCPNVFLSNIVVKEFKKTQPHGVWAWNKIPNV